MSASDIWDSLVSDDDDDHTPVKQDYDLCNVYGREQVEIEKQTDTLSEDDDIQDMDTNDQVLADTLKTSRTSNRTQVQVSYLFHIYFSIFFCSLSKKNMHCHRNLVNYLHLQTIIKGNLHRISTLKNFRIILLKQINLLKTCLIQRYP